MRACTRAPHLEGSMRAAAAVVNVANRPTGFLEQKRYIWDHLG